MQIENEDREGLIEDMERILATLKRLKMDTIGNMTFLEQLIIGSLGRIRNED